MSEYPEVDAIARLMELAARYGLEELEVEEGGLKVRLAAPPEEGHAEEPDLGGGRYRLWRLPSWQEPEPEAPPRSETARAVLAPLTGHFYRGSNPADPPFVEVGSVVEEGQTLCLIEAMKVYSDVHAEFAGRVVEIAAQNGQLVQHGDVLMYVEPSA